MRSVLELYNYFSKSSPVSITFTGQTVMASSYANPGSYVRQLQTICRLHVDFFMLFHLWDLKIKCIFLCVIVPDVQFTDKFSTHRLSGPKTSFLGLLYSHSLPTTCISSSQKLTQVYKQSFIYKTVIIYSVMF